MRTGSLRLRLHMELAVGSFTVVLRETKQQGGYEVHSTIPFARRWATYAGFGELGNPEDSEITKDRTERGGSEAIGIGGAVANPEARPQTWPYYLYYRVVDDVLQVLALWHTSRGLGPSL